MAPMSNTALQVLIKMYKHTFTHECITLSQVECFRPQSLGQELEGCFFCWTAKTWKTLPRLTQGWMMASGDWCFLSVYCSIQSVNNLSSGHRWMEHLQTWKEHIYFFSFKNIFYCFFSHGLIPQSSVWAYPHTFHFPVMQIFCKREIQEIHISFFKAKYGVLECLNCQVLLKLRCIPCCRVGLPCCDLLACEHKQGMEEEKPGGP